MEEVAVFRLVVDELLKTGFANLIWEEIDRLSDEEYAFLLRRTQGAPLQDLAEEFNISRSEARKRHLDIIGGIADSITQRAQNPPRSLLEERLEECLEERRIIMNLMKAEPMPPEEGGKPDIAHLSHSDLSTRTYNALMRIGIRSLYDISCLGRNGLLKFPGITYRMTEEIKDLLKEREISYNPKIWR